MKTDRQKAHQKYLQSKEWAVIRADILIVNGERCEICGSPYGLNVHHLSYERVGGDEEPEDLIVLCRKCHMAEHGIKGKKKKKRVKKKVAGKRPRSRAAKSRDKFLGVKVNKIETVAEFLARGGKVT